jgi:hypothetical protein
MYKTYIVFFTCSLLCACTPSSLENTTETPKAETDTNLAKYWIQKSLDFHDPERSFDLVPIDASIRSTTIRDTTERLRKVFFNTAQNTFEMRQKTDTNDVVYQVPISKEVTDSLKIARSNMYQNYFRYMLGGAMVLGDSVAIVKENVKDTVLFNQEAKLVAIQYEPIGETPNWYFTFSAETGAMLQSRFVYNEGKADQRGEFINYGPYVDYKGMRITSKLQWFYLNGDPLATEHITYR